MQSIFQGSWYAILATFAFFTIKGICWLVVPAIIIRLRSNRRLQLKRISAVKSASAR